ncbi:phosphoesterase [Deltaproteobacteria bacterium]|nr:phosphoesterase [Deltaproteobacteria bacterium]
MLITIICLSLLVFSAWYTPFRLKRLWGMKRAWPLQVSLFLLLAGFYGILAARVYTSTNPVAAWAYNVLGLLFIFQVYLFMYLLAAHILSPLLKKIPGKGLAAAGIIICLSLVGFGFNQAQSFTVTNHEIKVRGLARPVSIMHIPDLHLGAQRGESYLHEVVEAINRQNPDIVLYNGDLVDSNIALRPELFTLFKAVKAEQYFTMGNHEFYLDTEKALELIKNAGLRILRSEMVETHGLQLIGLEYMNADRVTYDSHMVNDLTIEEELPKIRRATERPSLLAHHSPVGLPYVSQGNIDVMLSGHTHGGQLFPGTIVTGLRFPVNKGRYQAGGTTLLVSQGAGTFGPWMRLGTFSEVQVVTLIPNE